MGITTTSCIRGARNGAFATENRANRAPTNAIINGCPDDAVARHRRDFAAETNNCAGGINELQDDVGFFTFFMAHLAPPPQHRDHGGFGRGSRPDAVQLGWPAVRELPPRRRRHLRVDLGRRRAVGHPLPSVLRLPRARHGDARRQASATTATPWRSPAACGPRRCGACARATGSCTTAARPTSARRSRRTTAARTVRAPARPSVQRALHSAEERPDRLPQHAVDPNHPQQHPYTPNGAASHRRRPVFVSVS